MKRLLTTVLSASVFLISGCIEFQSIDQPLSVSRDEIFTVYIEVYSEGGPSWPYFGVCLPMGWSVPGDSIPCTGIYEATIFYDSTVSFDQENESPAPEGYYWWAGVGADTDEDTTGGIVYGELQIQTDDQLGCYSLDYMLGNSYDGVNRERSDDHLIWIVDEYTPTAFQAVEGDNSVMMSWRPPVHSGGLSGYNIYRDQQVINTGLIVDTTYSDDNPLAGAHRYAVSAICHNGDEHLIPYEIVVVYGEYLYVSPYGDDSNYGSSFEDAFLTITYALSIISPDSLHPKAILLGPGVYSPDSTGEEFPIAFINYVSLIGAGQQASILDADNQSRVLQFRRVHDVSVSDLTLTNGNAVRGGGIYCYDSSPLIKSNTVSGNTASEEGGGIHCDESSPIISDNTITGNTTGWAGGGIHCNLGSPVISNNTISRNTGSVGGGIYCWESPDPVITNTIFWGNIPNEVSGSPTITYCDIQGGWEGEGNIDTDPLFVDPDNGNYNVCSQSPCIDAGDPNMEDPDGTRADIGVFYPDHPECDIGNIRYVSTAGSDTTGDGSRGNPFRTIQHAIDISFHLDTVIVESGTYMENINICSKSIFLASNYIFSGDTLDIQNTIIDGNSDATVVVFESCGSPSAITGFTIRNGNGAYGGGIYCRYNSSPTISYNTISGNTASEDGGGICCDDSDPAISNNTISGNTANGNDRGGGGICCLFSSDPEISNNIINGNSGRCGGGICCDDNSNPAISRNAISGNTASYGGGIACDRSNPAISNNIISEDTASAYGGGIFCHSQSHPNISNNTISRNIADNGGGINCRGGSCPTINNNTISENWAFSGGGIYCYASSEAIITNSILWSNTAYEVFGSPTITYCNIQGGWEGEGNIDIDPLFRDPDNGDFHLMSTECADPYDSPCIDTGSPAMIDSLLDCSWGLGTILSDMGAYGGGDSAQVGIDDSQAQIPEKFALKHNYPNPFNASTIIQYSLPEASDVIINVYDILGRRVETIIQGEQPAGYHQVVWHGSDHASGLYFYRIQAGEYAETRKMVLLK